MEKPPSSPAGSLKSPSTPAAYWKPFSSSASALGTPEQWRRVADDCLILQIVAQEVVDDLTWSPAAPLPESVDQWLAHIQSAFSTSSDVVTRKFTAGRTQPRAAAVVYLDGMIDMRTVDQDVIAPLQHADVHVGGALAVDTFLSASAVQPSTDQSQIVDAILTGDAALFLDGGSCTYLVDAKGYKTRSPEQPTTERTILGSKEAFVEPLRTNTAMIRRRVRSRHLHIMQMPVGRLTPSIAAVLYMDNVADPTVVMSILSRLHAITADAVMTSAELAAYLKGPQASPFPQVERTERPEIVSREVVNGRVGVLLENDPFAMLLPTTFWDMLQAHGDYTQSAWGATMVRAIRFMAHFFVAAGPGLYAAFLMVHLDLVPHDLALTIVGGRRGLPVPASLEYAFLILIFEILREVSIRIPQSLGPTIGVVGGIVLGQAVVQSGIASPPLIVAVSLVGLSMFTAPHYQMVISNRYLAISGLVMGAIFGLYGMLILGIIVILHLNSLTSYGTPYLAPAAPWSRELWKDLVIRAPFKYLAKRPNQYRPLQEFKRGGLP